MNFRRSNRSREATLDMTPLIDVVFLLLIFFLVTTTFTKKENDPSEVIVVNLPTGSSGVKAEEGEKLILSVTSDGKVRVNEGPPVEQEVLLPQLRSLHETAPDTMVMLRGDLGTSHGRIIEVLDQVKLSGFQKVNMVVKANPATS